MQYYRLPRSNQDTLSFHGAHLASAGDDVSLDTRGRWIELNLFRTDAGRYVLAATLRCGLEPCPGDLHEATLFPNALDAIRSLRLYGRTLGPMAEDLILAASRQDPSFFIALRRSRIPQPRRIQELGQVVRNITMSRDAQRCRSFATLQRNLTI